MTRKPWDKRKQFKAKPRSANGTTRSDSAKSTPGRRIEGLIEKDEWNEARAVIKKELKLDPDNHWLLTRLGLTYYEQGRYRLSLRFTKKALALQPNCPLVLWDYAGDLQMLGRTAEALAVLQQLLGLGVKQIAFGECGEGMRWAQALVNDCHYRMADCYRCLGDIRSARFSLLKFLHNRGHGVASIYDVARAEDLLEEVSNGKLHSGLRGASHR